MLKLAAIVLLSTLALPATAQLRPTIGELVDESPGAAASNFDYRAPALVRGLPESNDRPRLSVSLSPQGNAALQDRFRRPAFSWSLEAWEMNTASLAHIQCNRATRSVGSVVAEDCRFVSQPLPDSSTQLMQVGGRWMASPGIEIGAGMYAGNIARHGAGLPGSAASSAAINESVEGVNLNLNFGMRVGHIGELLLDLQLDRFRRSPNALLHSESPLLQLIPGLPAAELRDDYSSAAALGLGWQGGPFSADVTGQYQQLPLWLGDDVSGEGFRSFDIEFSWRAPINASISVGVSNLLNELPAAAMGASELPVEEAVEGIYGRIPYVRYKHDL